MDRSQEKSSRFKKSTRRHKVLPKTNFLSVKSKRSNIFIETDARQDKKITVSIFANGGQALSERGIYRWRQEGAGKKVRISLDEMKLVPGEYLVVVNVDHLSRRLRVSHRAGSAKFKRQLLGYKKLMSFYHQQEKHQLRPLLAKVQKEAESLLKSMNANVAKRKKARVYKAWLKEYRRVSRRVFPKAKKARLKRALYPEYWWELKMAWKKVGWVATEYSKSYENPRGELKKNFQKTLTQISRLKKDVDSLSLF